MRLGAVKTFDYHSQSCGKNIENFTKGTLAYVLDCISSAETMTMCYEAIGASGGKYVALEPFSTRIKYTRRNVHADWIMAITIFGVPVKLDGVYGRTAVPEHRILASRIFHLAENLMDQQLLDSPPFETRAGGLEAVPRGIEDMRMGRRDRGKLVYRMG